METELIMVGLGLFLELLALIAVAIWVVSKIRATTELLSLSVTSLKESIDALADSVKHLDTKVDNHSERIVRLETLGE